MTPPEAAILPLTTHGQHPITRQVPMVDLAKPLLVFTGMKSVCHYNMTLCDRYSRNFSLAA